VIDFQLLLRLKKPDNFLGFHTYISSGAGNEIYLAVYDELEN